jgi:hypothetical protein
MSFQEKSMFYLSTRITELPTRVGVNNRLSFDVEKTASNTGKVYIREGFIVVATMNFNFQYDSATFEFKFGNKPNKHVIGDRKGDLTLSLDYHDSELFPPFVDKVIDYLKSLK